MKTKFRDILYFTPSLATQEPKKRFRAKKCNQKTNKKLSAVTSHPIYTMLDREDYLVRLIDEEHSEKDVLSKINKHLKNDDSVFIDLIMLRFYHRFDKERESEVIYKKIKE